MKIGIIGSGGMGTTLAKRFCKVGHQVSISSSRGAASLQEFALSIGAVAANVEQVINDNQVIVVSIPQKNIPQLPKDAFVRLSADVVVIDTCNYYPNLRDNRIPALDHTGIDSLWVEQELGVPVVKLFNSILAENLIALARLKGHNDRIALTFAGDRPEAKHIIIQLVEQLGFDPFDIGTIASSWKQQPGSPVYCRAIPRHEVQRRLEVLGDRWEDLRDIIIARRTADEALMKTDYPAYLKTLV